MNPREERLNNLVRAGYTEEEALFLYIVATHSGYFTDRQFLEFSGRMRGKHSQSFFSRLLAQKHASYHTYQGKDRVYHVFSRTVLKAIEREALRTRQRHSLDYIKTRLVLLDFVLSNLDYDYLETEAEKVPFFETVMKVSRDLLPARVYTSKASASKTKRYFVDGFPVFQKRTASGSPFVTFTYVEAGSTALKAFSTHLEAYRTFLRSLPEFEFLYLSPSDRWFKAAEAEFFRIVIGPVAGNSGEALLRYFHVRRTWETGERVAAIEVVFLNAARLQFCGQAFETLYQEWVAGSVKDGEVSRSAALFGSPVLATFRTQKCGDSLSAFWLASEKLGERSPEISRDKFSSLFASYFHD
jgi:hypothetical protein